MDNQSSNNVEIALIQHQLLSCNAEIKIKPSPDMGGNVEFSIGIATPKVPGILKRGDSFTLGIQIDITGKIKDTDDIAFYVTCKMEGLYHIVNCDDKGIPTINGFNLWTLSASQLCHLVAQFATDMVSRMGYKNIIVPAFIPSMVTEQIIPEKKLSKKSKK